MKRALFVLLLIATALFVFAWRLPASVLLFALPNNAQLERFVRLHDIEGTLWSGSARLTSALSPAAQRLSWRCAPSIATVAINCTVNGAVEATLSAKPLAQTLRIDSLSLQQTLDVRPNAAAAASAQSFSLTVKDALLSTRQIAFTGTANASDTTVSFGNVVTELGEVFLDCKPATDATTQCSLKNRASATRIDGAITLSGQRATGNVELNAPGAVAQKFSF
jgi:Type II secretion system (T2SS), protein N